MSTELRDDGEFRERVEKSLEDLDLQSQSATFFPTVNLSPEAEPANATSINAFPILFPLDVIGDIGLATVTLDLGRGGQHWHTLTLNGDIGLAFAFPPPAGGFVFYVEITQDGTGGHSITSFPAGLLNASQLDVLLNKGANARTLFKFTSSDEGVTYFGELIDLVSGGGGEFFGPWTADHDAGEFNLLNLNAITFRDSTQLGIRAVDTATPDGTFDRLEYDADNLGAHDFYVDRVNTTIPRFGITETSIESNVELNMNNQDILQIDRLRFISDSGAPVASNDPTIYLDGVSNMVFNIDDQKQWFWTNNNQTIMQLDRSGVSNDTILTIETDSSHASAVPQIDIFRDDPSPLVDDEFGRIRFIATDAGLSSQVYAQIAIEYESVTVGRIASSMIFVTSFDTGTATQFKPFIILNSLNDERIRMIEDVEIIQDIILQDGSGTSKLFFDGGVDTYFTGSSTSGEIQFFADGTQRFAMGTIGMAFFTDYFLQMAERAGDPADGAGSSTGKYYIKTVGGIAKPFFIGDGQAAVDLTSGGGTQTPITSDIDYDGFDVKDISNIEFRNTTGAPASGINAIWADAGGINIQALAANDTIDFRLGGGIDIRIQEDSELLWVADGHKIVPQATAFQIIASNLTDIITLWNGTGAPNETMRIAEGDVKIKTNTTTTGRATLELIQNNNTPSTFRLIGRLSGIAEDTNSNDVLYATVDMITNDSVTQGVHSGRLQLLVATQSGGVIPVIDIKGISGGDPQLGFYNQSTVARQVLASSPTAAQISTVLEALGLTKFT